jgi:TonB family protein
MTLLRTAPRLQTCSATAGEPETAIFRQLPTYEMSWRAMAVSASVHTILVALLICIPLAFFRKLETEPFVIVHMVAPAMVPKLELPRVEPQPKPMVLPLPTKLPDVEVPRPMPAPVAEPRRPEPKPPAPIVAETPKELVKPAAPAPAPPKAEVKTGAFETAAAATMKPRPAAEVQTGGFGVSYAPPSDGPRRAGTPSPDVGSFDLPAGQGRGNGTGGASGRAGVVMASGFGDARGAGAGGTSANGTGGGVRSGGFGDYNAPVASAARTAPRDAPPPTQPVEILSKPKPEYTQEARDQRLEGEVLLEVMFTARGEVRVLRTLRGLGRGLDEAAVRAAQQIRFKPATREGRPVDSTVNVHIVFRLA